MKSKIKCYRCNCGVRSRKKKPLTSVEKLNKIREIIETVENRCMAADGPVGPTNQEITDQEIRQIYRLTTQAH